MRLIKLFFVSVENVFLQEYKSLSTRATLHKENIYVNNLKSKYHLRHYCVSRTLRMLSLALQSYFLKPFLDLLTVPFQI